MRIRDRKVRTVWLLLFFLLLNTLDVWLTHQLIASGGMELNPILRPIAGSWMLYLKGLVVIIGGILLHRFGVMSFRTVLWCGCLILAACSVWNGAFLICEVGL